MEKFDAWWEDFSNAPEYKNGNYTREDLALEAFDAGMEAKTAETLRDKFAMAALQGMLASPFDASEDDVGCPVVDHFTKMSYQYADSMLAQRDIRRTCGNSD